MMSSTSSGFHAYKTRDVVIELMLYAINQNVTCKQAHQNDGVTNKRSGCQDNGMGITFTQGFVMQNKTCYCNDLRTK